MFGLKRLIEARLAVLVGLPWVISRRAADMQGFQFGRLLSLQDRHGIGREVGEYALHVQCAWRIVTSRRIVVGDRDLYVPESANRAVPEESEWDQGGASRRDTILSEVLRAHQAYPLRVHRVSATGHGDLRIVLSDNYRIEVFCDGSDGVEQWRFFTTDGNAAAVVMTGDRLDSQ